jgi:peptide/nickel transport system substrate-binding protein
MKGGFSMKKRGVFVLIGLVAVLTIGILISTSLYAAAQPKPGGTFRYCDLKSAGTLDPARVHQNQDIFLSSNVYNGLVNLVPGAWDVYPDLAENYEISDDKMVYTFYLRKGVKFHNGRELTAEDVLYTLERARQKKFVNSARLRSIGKVEAPDKYTVRITLDQFDNVFLVKLAGSIGSGVVPKEFVEKHDKAFGTGIEANCGTGPFIVKQWNPGRNVILEANSNYFRGRPNIDQVEMRTISSRSAEVLEFEAGGLDMATLKPPYDKKFLANPKWKPYCQSRVYPNIYWYGFDINQKPFDNAKLRKALAHSFDRERAVKIAGGGLGEPAYTPLSPGFEAFDPNLQTYAYNPEKAKKLLAEAGYPKGIDLKMHVWSYTPSKQYTEFYQAQLAELGINLKVEFVEMGTFKAEVRKGRYPFYGLATSLRLPDSAATFYQFFHSDNFGAAGNYTNYKNETVDKYLNLAMKERNSETRVEYLKKVQHQVLDDCVWITDHRTQRTQILQPWVHGLEGKIMGVTGRWPLINLGDGEIWIDAKKQKK